MKKPVPWTLWSTNRDLMKDTSHSPCHRHLRMLLVRSFQNSSDENLLVVILPLCQRSLLLLPRVAPDRQAISNYLADILADLNRTQTHFCYRIYYSLYKEEKKRGSMAPNLFSYCCTHIK